MPVSRFATRTIATIVLLTLASIAVTGCHQEQEPSTPQEIANTFSHLPPEAKIMSAREGEWGDDGDVKFTLPDTRTADDWLGIVWRLNVIDARSTDRTTRYHWNIMGDGVKFKTLDYDPATHEFSYDQVSK